MALRGVKPIRAVSSATLRGPTDADAGDVGDDKPRMPEHEQRRVQCGKNSFADDATGGVEQTTKLFAARPVVRKVNERKKFRQHDDGHADDENQRRVRRAAPIFQIRIERSHGNVGQPG